MSELIWTYSYKFVYSFEYNFVNAFFSDFQIQIQMRFNLTRPLRDFLSPSVAPKGLWVSKNVMLSMARWYLGLDFFLF